MLLPCEGSRQLRPQRLALRQERQAPFYPPGVFSDTILLNHPCPHLTDEETKVLRSDSYPRVQGFLGGGGAGPRRSGHHLEVAGGSLAVS